MDAGRRRAGFYYLPGRGSGMADRKEGGRGGPMAVGDIAVRGTLMAAIITAPSLLAFFASWSILGDPVQAAVVGGVVHFAALGFSFKLSRRLAGRGAGRDPDA